jgi:translation initiation factor 1
MGKKKKKLGLSDLGGMVFSTDPDYVPPSFDDEEGYESIPNHEQTLYVSYDKKQRKGKVVTLVQGFEGSEDDLQSLGKLLKNKCGAGGTAKDGEILVQGNFVTKIMDILVKEGFKVKKKGG